MTGSVDDKRDFFVSFNQADREWATWIAWVVEEAGYSVLFQDWDFKGSFIEHMHQASLRAGRTLVVLSDNYLRSEYARSEAWAALAHDPVGREDRTVNVKVGPIGDLGFFSHFGYLDLTDSTEADAERLLLERAKKSLDPTYRPKPSTRPDFPGRLATKPPFPAPAAGPALAINNLLLPVDQPPLPPKPARCIGRDHEVEALVGALLAGEPTLVIGAAGIGKSTVCLQALHDARIVGRFGVRRYFVRLDGAATTEDMLASIGATLGISAHQARTSNLIGHLAAAPAALALDNLETPWQVATLETEAALAELAAVPGVALAVTFRRGHQPGGPAWRPADEIRPLGGEDARRSSSSRSPATGMPPTCGSATSWRHSTACRSPSSCSPTLPRPSPTSTASGSAGRLNARPC